MTDAPNNIDDLAAQVKPEDEEAKPEATLNEGEVKLSKAQYDMLLDRLEELESTPSKPIEDELDDLTKDLYAEPKTKTAQPASQQGITMPNFDDMTNKQMVDWIVTNLGQVVSRTAQPLVNEITHLKVLQEMDKCERKHDDYSLYEEDIMKIAIKKPSLSIEEAYKLAKAEDPIKGEGVKETGEKTSRTKTERLLNLPSRGSLGDKSKMPSNLVQENKVYSLEEAAKAAFAKIQTGGK